MKRGERSGSGSGTVSRASEADDMGCWALILSIDWPVILKSIDCVRKTKCEYEEVRMRSVPNQRRTFGSKCNNQMLSPVQVL